jgi:hypothetical protein
MAKRGVRDVTSRGSKLGYGYTRAFEYGELHGGIINILETLENSRAGVGWEFGGIHISISNETEPVMGIVIPI